MLVPLFLSNGYITGFYDGSHLFINGDSIDLEVVPEPSTWAMLALALVLLAAWRRTLRQPAPSQTSAKV